MDKCDFCYSDHVVKRFQCCDFDSASKDAGVMYPNTQVNPGPTNLILASHDYWAACAPCAELVELEDLDGLLQRALEEYEKRDGDVPHRIRVTRHLRRTYKLFFKNRIRVVEDQ